jgi:ribosomal protein S18 acetylase RimI-like enzyme
MTERNTTLVRAFDGSLADAKGLLAVERETFDESPYTAPQVQTMLNDGPQRAWLALAGSEVVGFIIAFATAGLSRPCWELDLLAIHPHWQGRGLATALIRAASAGSPGGLLRARAVVATDNGASARAFTRAGFQPAPEICTLLVYRPQEAGLRPRPIPIASIREATRLQEASRWFDDLPRVARPSLAPDSDSDQVVNAYSPTLLLAELDGQPAGHAELIEVQTLLYRGAWIESLVAPTRAVREALIEEAVGRGIAAGWDEIGAMVPERDWALRNTLLAQGFRSLGDFCWLTADLPLPDPTSSSHPLTPPKASAEDVEGRWSDPGSV